MSKRKRDAPRAPGPSEVGSDDQVQKTLDDALADSFPASDPVSIVTSQHEEAWRKADERENWGKREHDEECEDEREPPEAGSPR